MIKCCFRSARRSPGRALALLLACCAIPLQPLAAAPVAATTMMQVFDPVAFFTGRTEGIGQLKKVFSSAHRTLVHGHGVLRGDGVLVLDQRVEEAGEPARTRQWHLRQASPGDWRGTLSDASGPVSATLVNGRLHIHYTMKGGMTVDQVLTLSADGRSAQNEMKIRKFGITVATLRETILRV
jgi:hypothetical protein